SEVMISTMEALEAWWPPTFSPLGLGRTRLAASTMAVAIQRTFSAIAVRVAVSSAPDADEGAAAEETETRLMGQLHRHVRWGRSLRPQGCGPRGSGTATGRLGRRLVLC